MGVMGCVGYVCVGVSGCVWVSVSLCVYSDESCPATLKLTVDFMWVDQAYRSC